MSSLHSDTSPSNQEVPENTKGDNFDTDRPSTSSMPINSIPDESFEEETGSDKRELTSPVSEMSEDCDSDPSSPPAKKRRSSVDGHPTKRKLRLTRWKSWAKQRLVDAFKECTKDTWLEYKPPDLELCSKILAKFPENSGITQENIQSFIHNVCIKEHRRRIVHGYPIEKWIEIIDAVSPKENIITKQLELIMNVAKQEPNDDAIPPPTFDPSLPQPNYEAVYDYLSKAFSAKSLPKLTPIDSLVVEDLMQSLVFQVESLNDGELRKSLRQVYLHFVQEPDEEPEHEHDELRKSLIHSITILNPLGLNAQSIVPVTPK